MAKRDLLSDDDGSQHREKITVNREFAVKYEARKKKQELTALKEKYEGVSSDVSTDSESEEDEDESGELLTREVDAKILTILATVKARDPSIYSKEVKFFDDEEATNGLSRKETEKKLTLKEFQNRRLLDGGESEAEDQNVGAAKSKYATEQDSIKMELKRAFYTGEQDGNLDDDLIMTKEKTKEELEREEEEYKNFLLENLKSNPNAQQAMQDWIAYSSKNDSVKLSESDKFLVGYIMNRGWIERTSRPDANVDMIIKAVEESEEEAERTESFEEKFNFRYEHASGATVITHPREIPDSMRRKESKRQHERTLAKQRKEEERVKREEELKRLKNLKRGELMRKAKKLVQVSGTEAAKRLLEDNSDSEFDPEKHDRKMARVFNQEYYSADADKISDASDPEEKAQTKPVRKLITKVSRSTRDDGLPEAVKKAIEEQLFKLDYEDKIDDLPCRFKYRPVPGSTYGLDVSEILAADDKALNRHVSLKKLAPYRPEDQQLKDIRKYGDKRRVWMFRHGGDCNDAKS